MSDRPQHSPTGAHLPAPLQTETGWLVVRRRTVLHHRLLWAGAAVLLALAVYGTYELGRHHAGYHRLAVGQERAARAREVADLRRMNQSLRERLHVLETSLEIDREAYRAVEGSLAELQEQLRSKQQELQFYQGIVSPEDRVPGLRIQRFEVLPQSPSRFVLRLVLVQALRQEQRVSGSVDVTVNATTADGDVALTLAQLLPPDDDADDLPFSFRYFQDIEKELVLPAGVTPQSVEIELTPSGRGSDPLRESFNWPAPEGAT